jgi:hypothetical protein
MSVKIGGALSKEASRLQMEEPGTALAAAEPEEPLLESGEVSSYLQSLAI